jgi:uncharacterized cupredoxin-like copper-binding protein
MRIAPRGRGGSAPDFEPLSVRFGPTFSRGRLFAPPVVAAALALAAVGCGGGGGSSSTSAVATSAATVAAAKSPAGKATTLHVDADASGLLQFDKTSLTAPAGKVTIVMKNPSPLSHDIAIEGNGVDEKGPAVSTGGTSTVTAVLKPGTYTFLCTVDGHADAGMKGTLTVS